MGENIINEPTLMFGQNFPFNGDSFICNEFIQLRDKYGIKTAIELGSCVGGTTKFLGLNFEKVYTIEINETFRNFCLSRIRGINNIESILGDTVNELPCVLQKCEDNPIIFIDSHWLHNFPLIKELKIIAASGLEPIIAIHDFKIPNEPKMGFDTWNGIEISYETVKPYLDEIYEEKGYTYYYNSDETSTEIKRGIIYICPND